MKILVIDDSEIRLNLIVNNIKKSIPSGVDVDTADTTFNGLRALKAKQYDFLILDVILPRRKDEVARYDEGLYILDMIHSDREVFIPNQIIGITADQNQIVTIDERFGQKGLFLVRTSFNEKWLDSILSRIELHERSLITQEKNGQLKNIVTIHGIRTVGAWQVDFQKIVESKIPNTKFLHYSYPLLDIWSFISPKTRQKQVKDFYKKLVTLSEDSVENIYFFAHSNGTYILAKALILAAKNNINLKIKRIVLSGSVLKDDFDWSAILSQYDCLVINECGLKDNILILNEIFIFDAGMAGRVGFKNIFSNNIINRYYNFGHSDYFDKEFMDTSWSNLITSSKTPAKGDCVIDSNFKIDFIHPIASLFGKTQLHWLIIIFLIILSYL